MTPTTLPTTADRLVWRARHELSLLRTYVRRTNVTGWVSRNAGAHYRNSFAAVVAVEDALGRDDRVAVELGDRLRGLYHEARDACLLSVDDIGRLEREAIAAADRLRTADTRGV